MNKLGGKILRIVGLISLVSMVILVLSNFIVFKFLFTQLQTDAKNIVAESVKYIDGDKLEKVIGEKSMDSAEYKKIQQSMMEFRSDKNIRFFYTLTLGDNKAYIAVDSAMVETSPFGEEYKLEREMVEAFKGNITYTGVPVSDKNGTFISAYAPIKNSAGRIIAIAGVDKDVGNFVYINKFLLMMDMIVAVIVLLLSVLLSFLFSRRITKNVRQVTNALNKMSSGDLTVPVNVRSKDEIQEIADYINKVRINTAGTLKISKQVSETVAKQIENLSAVSEEMSAGSEEVAATIQEVARGTNLQSEEMEKINNILVKFGERISETVNAVETVNSRVEAINSRTQLSHKDLRLLEDTIKDISASFTVVRSEIKDLGTSLQQISEVTDLINAISGQTNLLALNAAIEANRAGETGRGFAVVAGEIRKLAEQSKTSVANITKLLETVTNKSDMVVKTSDIMERKLNEQVSVIGGSINSFSEIISDVEEIIPGINDVSSNINNINEEKENIIKSVEATTAVAEEVSASSKEIAASSQQLSASSQDVASAAQDLNEASVKMLDVMTKFKI